MKVLVTGARGFVGSNLCAALKSIRDGKDRRERYQALLPLEVFECDKDSSAADLEAWCAQADFVFNLAGVNRPKDPSEFAEGNSSFVEELLGLCEKSGNRCPVMLASSAQASLEGRFAGSEYGKSKLAGESALRAYAERTGAPALIYRFPNVYGKWCRPHYNSAVATFCHQVAHGEEPTVADPSICLELLYIDDLVTEMLDALLGEEHRCDYEGLEAVPNEAGPFCRVPVTDRATLGEIVSMLKGFRAARRTLDVPDAGEGSLSKKLHATYLSYLDAADFAYPLKMNVDARGSFTELLRTADRGQVSINVSKPGVTKGQHWHHTKWEKFCVVSGEALIRLRRVGTDAEGEPFPVAEYRVSGDDLTVVEMVPGYTHSIANVSDERDLVTVMWCNECFDPKRPDTFGEEV